ncbi:hypothetical protein O181_055972 [Austropuccinia psidii MF-1]|uniref:Uncharacterized protein n=1 Tax=Austropuccinia psidii MF-1 TaxID=1389203 RepID=A0A9Q3EES4_9BASI|nr:hypothetical protein [Austropuccinia psidii MF-1]
MHFLQPSPSSINHSSSLNINNQPLNQQVITSRSSLNTHSNPLSSNPLNPHSTYNHTPHSNLTSNTSYLIPRQLPSQTQKCIGQNCSIFRWISNCQSIESLGSTCIHNRTCTFKYFNRKKNWSHKSQ